MVSIRLLGVDRLRPLVMKNVLNDSDRTDIHQRLGELTPEMEPAWGTLTAPEMICHLKDFMAMALGDRPVEPQGNWFMRSAVVPKFLLYVMPWPRAKIETPPEIDPKRGGSQPGEFEEDRAEVQELLERFVEIPDKVIPPHPNFGRLSKRDWGRAIWRNCDHHLQQFGL